MNFLEKPKLECTFDSSFLVYCVSFSPNELKMCSVGKGKKLLLYDLSNKRKEKDFTGHFRPIWSCDYSPSGKVIATGSADSSVRMWYPENDQISTTPDVLRGHSFDVYCVKFNNDGKLLLSGGSDQSIRVWNSERKECVSTLKSSSGTVYGVDILPDNQTIVSGHSYKCSKLWDLRQSNEKCVHTFKCDITGMYVLCVKFHPNGSSFATGSYEKIKFYDFRKLEVLQTYEEHSSFVRDICFHPSGNYLISGSEDRTVKIFDLLERKVLHTLSLHSSFVNTVPFSSSGMTFASGGFDKKINIWRCNFLDEGDTTSSSDIIKSSEVAKNNVNIE